MLLTAILAFSSILSAQGVVGERLFLRGRRFEKNHDLVDVDKTLPPEEWFEQTLDHFNSQDSTVWKQRFFRNASFYENGGPVFLMVGGEGEASARWMVEGTWLIYAKTFKALCFQLEHRFYGQSRPTKDLSIQSLEMLSSEQALADLAAFIDAMNKDLPPNTKWILFGGSYPGSLAAWARARYPHLVHASMSASGPLLAVADFQDYYKVVEEALGPNCSENVATAQQQLQLMLSHRVGQQTAAKLFRLCQPINPEQPEDIQNFYETLASNFAGIVQYNKDNRLTPSRQQNITVFTLALEPRNEACCGQLSKMCSTVSNSLQNWHSGGSSLAIRLMSLVVYGVAVRRLAALSNLLLDTSDQTCLDAGYDSTVKSLKNESWDSTMSEGGRQWTYQTCTEFGFFQTSTRNETQRLFGQFPLSLFEKQCTDIFGTRFSSKILQKGINRSNIEYGGMHYKAERVVFVHGTVDPWHALGITSSDRPRTPAILINGTAHCANMYPPRDDDLPALTTARQSIQYFLGNWLNES